MSTTPGTKLSPLGNRISKTLLTPCRRVGLSRKIKTPKSIPKLHQDLNILNTSDQSSDVTPVNKKSGVKRKSLIGFNSPMEKNSKFEDVKSEFSAKKSLDKCFKNSDNEVNNDKLRVDEHVFKQSENIDDNKSKVKIKNSSDKTKNKKTDNGKDEEKAKKQVLCEKVLEECDFNIVNKENAKAIHTIAQIHVDGIKDYSNNYELMEHDYFKTKIKTEDIVTKELKNNSPTITSCISEASNSSSSTDYSPITKTSHKKNRILSDSDDDFIVSPTKPIKINQASDKNIQSSSSEILNKIIDCKVNLLKLSEDDIGNNSEMANLQLVKKKKLILDDDDDFCPKRKKDELKMKLKIKSSSKTTLIRDNSTKDASEKKNKSSKTTLSKFSSRAEIEDDNDAFTSTPDREKNEKIELIDKIENVEFKIKEKKQKLDALNRATLYKSKHNIDELKNLTETWRQGCVLGLNELLDKLRTHGPIDMPTLLRNLHIQDDMVHRILKNT